MGKGRQKPERQATRKAGAAGAVGWVLSVAVFVCGAVLMALEIAGSRVLAPYFGNSIFVWGSLISIVLAALSLGYWLGGMAADRWPNFPAMAAVVAAPGLVIFVLPFVYPGLNRWIAATDLGGRLGPLAASLVLFLLPSVCLGAVSPYAVRLRATAVAKVGATAGTLYAISTGGSIFGTLLTAFYLIGALGVGNILHGLGLALVALACLMFAASGRRLGATALLLVGLLLGLFLLWHSGSLAQEDGVLLEQDTFYHHIRVSQRGDARFLDFDNLRQSAMLTTDPDDLYLPYTRYLALAMAFRPEARRILFIGLGGGSLPKRIHRDFPEVEMDAVEIDPEVVRVAEGLFGVRPDRRLRLVVEDGRLFTLRQGPRYDLVFLDAYNSDTIPFHLTTREFYEELKARLAPDAVVASNIIGAVSGPRSRLFRAMAKTLRATFPQLYLFPAYGIVEGDFQVNIIAVATMDPRRRTRSEVVARALALGEKLFPPSDKQAYAAHLHEGPVAVADVPLLTDDFAPVDLLLHL